MGSSHHHHHHSSKSLKNLKTAFFLNLAFTIIEIIGGFLTNSVAILSDALHDFGDSISLGLSWYLEKISDKPRTQKFTYGFKRFSLLAALINSIILITGSLLILIEALTRLFAQEAVHAEGMLALALLGIFVNGLAAFKLKKGQTLNEKMVQWHFLEDVLGWVAVLIVSITMMFVDWPILDPVLSIGLTFYILWNVFKNLKKVILVFLQGLPEEKKLVALEELILATKDVLGLENTHLWTLDGETYVFTAHVIINENLSTQDVQVLKEKLRDLIDGQGIHNITLEIQPQQKVV